MTPWHVLRNDFEHLFHIRISTLRIYKTNVLGLENQSYAELYILNHAYNEVSRDMNDYTSTSVFNTVVRK
jgi:hypothetical protein